MEQILTVARHCWRRFAPHLAAPVLSTDYIQEKSVHCWSKCRRGITAWVTHFQFTMRVLGWNANILSFSHFASLRFLHSTQQLQVSRPESGPDNKCSWTHCCNVNAWAFPSLMSRMHVGHFLQKPWNKSTMCYNVKLKFLHRLYDAKFSADWVRIKSRECRLDFFYVHIFFSSTTCLSLLHPFPYFLLHSKRCLLFNGSIIKCCSQQAPIACVPQACSTSATGAAANNL